MKQVEIGSRSARRSYRPAWFLQHQVSGGLMKTIGPDGENGMLAIHLAGGRDFLYDYEQIGVRAGTRDPGEGTHRA